MAVAPFKKGPDFIDAGWLAMAAKHPCHNLDTFMQPPEKTRLSFSTYTNTADMAVIEGNRGLYDGLDVQGTTSTAELAKLLQVPVILVVDCTKSTRTVAAMVMGCLWLDPDVPIAGIVLNRLAGKRHEAIVRDAVQTYCHLPVVGTLPKIKDNAFPERHMGLVPTPEHTWAQTSIDQAQKVAEQYVDIETILTMAAQKEEDRDSAMPPSQPGEKKQAAPLFEQNDIAAPHRPRIGVIQDSAFQFYYPENMEALQMAGANLIPINALEDAELPLIDGLYIGGGFPETHAEALANNDTFRKNLLQRAQEGLPIYAECGGLMYLGESLVYREKTYPMVGALPVVFGFSKRPQGHGYSIFQVVRSNPFFTIGTQVRGHEFHYSHVLEWSGKKDQLAFQMVRGGGLDGTMDGLCYKNTLATYTHLHALGTPSWAKAMVKAARAYRERNAD